MNWSKVRHDAEVPMRNLYNLMVEIAEKGKKSPADKIKLSSLRRQLRNIGVLSLPFSLNIKKFAVE